MPDQFTAPYMPAPPAGPAAPASGTGYPVMGVNPRRRPRAGYPGAQNYPTRGNTYPLVGGAGARPGVQSPPQMTPSSPPPTGVAPSYTPPPGGYRPYGGGMMLNRVNPQQGFNALSMTRGY